MLSHIPYLFREYHLWSAFAYTIGFTIVGAIGALLIGSVVAIMRISPVPTLRFFGLAYVTLIRNTPLTLVIFFCVFGFFLGMNWSVFNSTSAAFWQHPIVANTLVDPIVANDLFWVAVGLSIYHASFVAEAIRSGVNTVPPGQAEAARAIGLSFSGTLSQVILPQAMRGAIAPLGNTFIALTKNTTVAATVMAVETAAAMNKMVEFDSRYLGSIFFIVAVAFVVFTLPAGTLFTRLSKRLAVAR